LAITTAASANIEILPCAIVDRESLANSESYPGARHPTPLASANISSS
jgi:hypothetical protein